MVLDCPPDLLATFLYDDSLFCLDNTASCDPPADDFAASKRMYCLMRVDEADNNMRMATDDDVSELAGLVSGTPDLLDAAFSVPPIHDCEPQWLLPLDTGFAAPMPAPLAAPVVKEEKPERRTPSPTGRTTGAGTQKPGGPCDHCGATESPQWRRGPASKPQLCNACGTRYRRTNQLGASSLPSSKSGWSRKRGAGNAGGVGQQVLQHQHKKQRCVSSMMRPGAASARFVRSQ